jgi:hypothetical protein
MRRSHFRLIGIAMIAACCAFSAGEKFEIHELSAHDLEAIALARADVDYAQKELDRAHGNLDQAKQKLENLAKEITDRFGGGDSGEEMHGCRGGGDRVQHVRRVYIRGQYLLVDEWDAHCY